MATRAIAIENVKTGEVTEAVYEHPFVVRPSSRLRLLLRG